MTRQRLCVRSINTKCVLEKSPSVQEYLQKQRFVLKTKMKIYPIEINMQDR